MSRIKIILYFIAIGFFSSVSCEAPEVNPFDQKVVDKMISKQIDEYLKLRLFNCREEILRDAEVYVDSMIAVQLSFSINQGIFFPSRPNSPTPVNNIKLDDTTKARPFLNYPFDKLTDTLKTEYKNGKN